MIALEFGSYISHGNLNVSARWMPNISLLPYTGLNSHLLADISWHAKYHQNLTMALDLFSLFDQIYEFSQDENNSALKSELIAQLSAGRDASAPDVAHQWTTFLLLVQ